MTNQESSQTKRVRLPAGLVNQIALALGVMLLIMEIAVLVAQIFFEYRLSLHQPTQHEIAVKIISLGFLAVLFTIQPVRKRFGLLWSAILGAVLASLIGGAVLHFPDNFIQIWEIFYSAAILMVATLFCLALLKGERLDEFLVKIPMLLLGKVLKIKIDDL